MMKKPFQGELAQRLLDHCDLNLDLKNDCYHTFDSLFPVELQMNRISMTYPATDRHIEKARATELELFNEKPSTYNDITQIYVNEQKSHLDWVIHLTSIAQRMIFRKLFSGV